MAEKSNFYGDYSGGVNLGVGRLNRARNEVSYAENVATDKVGPLTKVKGYRQRGAAVNDGYSILGMCSAYKSDGTRKQIVICDNASDSDAYTYNTITDTWTDHHLSLTSGAKAEFEYFLDGFFMVNFSDVTRWNNFTQWYTTTNVTNAPKAKFIKLYGSRIYLFYVVYDGSTYTSRCVYSDLPSGSPYTIAWDNAENYFDVDSDDGDVGMGLEVNANRLLLFKENSLYRYDTNTLYKVPGCPGTINNRSIHTFLGYTMYFHSTGLWMYDGSTATLKSRRIQELVDGVSTNNYTKLCSFSKGSIYYLYLGDVNNADTGLTINKCLLQYDIAKDNFTWRSLSDEPVMFKSYKDDRSNVTWEDTTVSYSDADITYDGLISSEKRIYFGTTDGYVYEIDKGHDMDGDPIAVNIETRDYYLGMPSLWKLISKVVVYVNNGKGITVHYRLDDGNWKTLGKVDKTQTELHFPSGSRCQRLRLKFTEMSTGGQFDIEGTEIFFIPEGLIE